MFGIFFGLWTASHINFNYIRIERFHFKANRFKIFILTFEY